MVSRTTMDRPSDGFPSVARLALPVPEGLSRRALLLAGSAAALCIGSTAAYPQQARWWEHVQGFGDGPAVPPQPSPRSPETLDDLKPDGVPWRSDEMLAMMDAAIVRVERMAAAGGCSRIADGQLLRVSDDDDRVAALKQRLGKSGLLRGSPGYFNSTTFDEQLEAAVRTFQAQFGLRVTGRVDRATLAELNVPADARLAQLKLNRRRIQDLLRDRVEDRHVFVNAAAYQLEAVERHEVHRRHRVIVGKPDRQTPAIKAAIRALNFFPSWHVPDSVARLDLIPRVRKEPEYLEVEHIRALTPAGAMLDARSIDWNIADAKRIRFRQDPGLRNALGLVRIDMPNDDIVYMHDTPMKPLFNQRQRAFSAGCVRVQDVFQLVEWIARPEAGWKQPGHAEQIVQAAQPVTVKLTRPVPVYFSYLTAWAEGDGLAVFRPDIYGRDGIREVAGGQDPDAPTPPQTLSP